MNKISSISVVIALCVKQCAYSSRGATVINPCRSLFEQHTALQVLQLLCVFLILSFSSLTAQSAVSDALNRPAVSTQLGPHSFLLGAAQAGERLVVVGERGLILFSDDKGQNWKQAVVPVSVTLTAVRFADSKNGFAIGHGGTVLSTHDAGETWNVRLDGRRIAEMMLASAKSTGDERAITSAERLLSEGPDKPLLDLLVLTANRLIVVGAYGIALSSEDGGQKWSSWASRIDNPGAVHLYSIRKSANRILIAGEMGMVWLSLDEGTTFTPLETPYEGSYFTGELQDEDKIVVAGLRGNAWRSEDNGAQWYQLNNPVPATITASVKGGNNELFMVNQAGTILQLHDKSLLPLSTKSLPPLNNILRKDNGEFLVLSIVGPITIDAGVIK